MAIHDPTSKDIFDPDYDVHFLDNDPGVEDPYERPLSHFAPSYLVFDPNRRLTFWSVRPQENIDDLAQLLQADMLLEDFTERALRLGIIDGEGKEVRGAVSERLSRFASASASFQLKLAGERYVRVADRRNRDGSTFTTILNVTDVERRERALAMLLGDHLHGQPVFERAVRSLAMGLGTKTASVARLATPGVAETIASIHGNEIAPSRRFVVKDTPCEPVYKAGYFTFAGDFLRRFPLINLDGYFAELGHGSYVGQVIFDRSGNQIGHILALDEAERGFDEGDRRLVRLVAEHVGFELERMAANSALESGEQRFRDFAETASDLFFEIDASLRCIYASDRARELTGISAEDWVGRGIAEFGPRDDPAWQGCLQDLAEHKPFRDVFFTTSTGSGRVEFSLSGKPVFDSFGTFAGYRMTARRTSDHKAEGRARQAEMRVRQVLSSSLEGFALFDESQKLALCNDKFVALLFPGVRMAIRPGMSLAKLSTLWLPGMPAADKRALRQFHMEPDSLASDNMDLTLTDGRELRVMRRSTEDGGIATVYLDITDLKRREQELSFAKEAAETLNKTKSRFLANVSHELRTPLNAIIGFAEVMRDEIFGPIKNPRYKEYVNDIRASGEHLLDMINDILDLEKAEAGQLELACEPVDMSEIVQSVVRMMHDQAEAGELTIETKARLKNPRVLADKRRVRQVLMNLLSNAIKFTPAGGRIDIALERVPGSVRVTIGDTGIGIAPEELGRVLQPFAQVDSELSRRHQGTGLGLPLAKRLVELHGGTLEISSERGQGTRIAVTFPAEGRAGRGE